MNRACLFFLATLCLTGKADQRCLIGFEAFGSRAPLTLLRDVAVEAELDISPEVMRLFTTRDGTLRPIIGENPSPGWLFKIARHPKQIKWDTLSYENQLRLLREMTEGINYFHSRFIPGLVIRPTIRLTFAEPTRLFGVEYPAGENEIHLHAIFQNVVEFGGHKDPGLINGVELHVRAGRSNAGHDPSSAGTVSQDTRRLFQALKIPNPAQHIHIVAPLPLRELAAQPRLYSALLTDIIRRANLVAEMRSIWTGGRIRSYQGTGEGGMLVDYFAPISPFTLRGIGNYFRDVARGGRRPKIGKDFKMGWVGMHGSDYYDQPNLWGAQYRMENETLDGPSTAAILDAIQHNMLNLDYGNSSERMNRWLQSATKGSRWWERMLDGFSDDSAWERVVHGGSVGALMEKTWYNQTSERLWEQMPTSLKDPVRRVGFPRLMKMSEHNQAFKMLVFDWSHDPLLFDQPQARQRVIEAQRQALESLAHNGRESGVLKSFLSESGLFQRYLGSFGLRMEP